MKDVYVISIFEDFEYMAKKVFLRKKANFVELTFLEGKVWQIFLGIISIHIHIVCDTLQTVDEYHFIASSHLAWPNILWF